MESDSIDAKATKINVGNGAQPCQHPKHTSFEAQTMAHAQAPKRATNVSLAESLLAEAKQLRINISQAAEAGVARAVAEKRAVLWVAENQNAFECWNAYVEKNGLPLGKYRSF